MFLLLSFNMVPEFESRAMDSCCSIVPWIRHDIDPPLGTAQTKDVFLFIHLESQQMRNMFKHSMICNLFFGIFASPTKLRCTFSKLTFLVSVLVFELPAVCPRCDACSEVVRARKQSGALGSWSPQMVGDKSKGIPSPKCPKHFKDLGNI